MDKETDKLLLREGLLMVVASFLLPRLSLGEFVFTIPVLLLAPKLKKKIAVGLVVIVGLAAIGFDIWDYREVLTDSRYYGLIGFSLIIPVCVTLVSAIWVGLRDYSRIVLRKLVICSIPVILMGIGFTLWLSGENGFTALSFMKSYIKEIIPEILSSQIDLDEVMTVFMTFFLVACAPLGVVFGSVPVLLSEFLIRKTDDQWQKDFANMSMPQVFFWFTCLCWIVGLCGSLFVEYPVWVTIIVWNLTFCFTLYYLLAGISVVCARAMKKNPEVKSSKICWLCILLCFLPGINLLFVFGLPVLGLLDTWMNLR